MTLPTKLQRQVRDRAALRCEYCHLPQSPLEVSFHIDHIVPKKHEGATEIDNLALSCSTCNAFKLDNISGLEPQSGALIRLFHPRNDDWSSHFSWNDAVLIGLSAIGRVTIAVLKINHPLRVEHRAFLLRFRKFPQP